MNPRPAVLIRTLDVYNGNYGGVLQAYALQTVLRDLGFDPVTDSSKRPGFRDHVKGMFSRSRQNARAPKPESRLIHEFVDQRITTVELFGSSRSPRKSILERFDAVMVGSDQVWRQDYADVGEYLLDFIPARNRIRRVSYAASFGSDHAQQLAGLQELAKFARRFDYLSVREVSAVDICQQLWGTTAVRVLDPTLLIHPSHLRELTVEGSAPSAPFLFSYYLDPNGDDLGSVHRIADGLGLAFRSITPYTDRTGEGVGSPLLRPSVEEWLTGIANAEFVVTDSFHGVALSILFNKEFVAVANTSRGAARFTSLLSLFGLSERLVDSVPQSAAGLEPIDWERVNIELESQREDSRTFLNTALQGLC